MPQKKSKKGNAPKQTKKNPTENASQESQEDKHISQKAYFLNEVCKFLQNNADLYDTKEDRRGTRTRSEASFSPKTAMKTMKDYIEELSNGIADRLKFFDRHGPTAWSEAPAEGVFSILGRIVETKPSLKVSHITKLCRVVREGPSPASKDAINITKTSIDKWPGKFGRGTRFTTNKYIKGMTSSTVASVLNT